MTSASQGTSGAAATNRFDQLVSQVQTVRRRGGAPGDLDRYLLIAGGVLMPLGGLFIVLGWVGASRTPLPFEQMDYLISGGVLGLGLVVAGGFTYFSYWQTVRIREARQQAAQLSETLQRLEGVLSAVQSSGADFEEIEEIEEIELVAPAPTRRRAAAGTTATAVPVARSGRRNGRAQFVATGTGSMFHRPDCAVVRDREDLLPVDAGATQLRPCRICDPLGA